MFPLFYFLFYPYSLLFFPLFFFFFFFHTHTLTFFFFLYFLLSSFSLPLPPHTCPYFFSLFPSFVFFPTTSHSRTFHTVSTLLSSLKVFAFFFFFDCSKATRKREDDDEEEEEEEEEEDDWNIRKSLISLLNSQIPWVSATIGFVFDFDFGFGLWVFS